ncbi:MAG: RNA-directed DNA polymerase [Clostridia bacterium]|nr:RNA-directed DNA polymerase [Clostridia bacterium]
MKSYGGNLFESIVEKDNFKVAQQLSRQGKSRRKEIRIFESNLDENLEEIRQLVINKKFHTAKYRSKKIYEPKERIIYILPYAPDRIVQHAIMNILVPYMEKMFITDSFACITGRGQTRASLRTMEAVRRNKYCLKCDIHHFYPSINQNILSEMYHRKFRDKDFLYLMDDIIFSFPGGYNCPIGNYTSQWNGNFYLTPLDNFCKHELRIRDYIRYCDDFLLFSDDKAYLHDCRKRIEDFIGKYELTYSKADVFSIKQGIDFCGYRHFDNYILLRKSTAKKEIKRLKELPGEFESGLITKDEMRSTIDSIMGWQKHANTHNLQIATDIDFIRSKYCA